jgi:hypothetical protein
MPNRNFSEKQSVNFERAYRRPTVLSNFDCAERCIVRPTVSRPYVPDCDIGSAAT